MRQKEKVSVDEIKVKINRILANDETSEDVRQAMCTLLESILFDAIRYDGFGYVDWHGGGCAAWIAAGEPENRSWYLGPEYKREYY